MGTLNEDLGRLRTGGAVGYCERCRTEQANGDLDYEATVHHGAHQVVCLARKACEIRKRKRKAS